MLLNSSSHSEVRETYLILLNTHEGFLLLMEHNLSSYSTGNLEVKKQHIVKKILYLNSSTIVYFFLEVVTDEMQFWMFNFFTRRHYHSCFVSLVFTCL